MEMGKDRTVVRIERTEIAGRIIAYLRELYPTKTAEHVASDLNTSVSAVEKWLSRDSAPCLPLFGKMALIYGPEFVSRAFPTLTWLDPVVRAGKAEKLKAQIAADQRRLEELTHL
jgi:hypothetical protein